MRLASVLAATVLAAALLTAGCQAALYLPMQFVYDEADLPAEQVRQDVPYWPAGRPDPNPAKHRLDLFLPDTTDTADRARANADGFPVVVFVHGGGWTEGDKDLRVGYQDVYGNIGRFFAQRGIGAAVVNYRLLSDSTAWPAQIEDVAQAVGFVHARIGAYGGNPGALLLMGHSAGAQLAMRVALDSAALATAGVPAEAICGVLPVSGAGLDLTDQETYDLMDDPAYYERRFGPRPDWQRAASPLRFVHAGAPPFLIFFAQDDYPALKRQSWLLHAALQAEGVPSEVVVVPGQNHERIVLALSHDDKTAGPAMVAFVRRAACR